MKRVKPLVKKSLITLAGILGIGTLTACYWVVVNYDYTLVEGKVKFEETGVSGIKITVYDEEGNIFTETYTEEDGTYSIALTEGKYKFVFEDVDNDGVNYKKTELSELINTTEINQHEIKNVDVDLEKA